MSNHLEHIEITNFKSIRHAKVEGCKRINVFIGYPNMGKSAIIEAVASLSYLQKNYNESYSKLCRIKNSSDIFYDGNITEDILIHYSNSSNIRICYVTEKDIDVRIEVSDVEKYKFQETELVKNEQGLLAPSIYKKIRFSDGNFNNLESYAKRDILKVKKYVFKGVYNDFKTNGLGLYAPFGENLVDIVQFNKGLRKEVGELFKFYDLKLLIDQANNSIRGLKSIDEETIFSIPFYQMADTLQRLIFHKAAILSNENTVLLFEEPEAHMFPPYIRKFTGDVIYDKGHNQFFISTHSPFVLDDFIEDARKDLSVYLVGLKNGETKIKRLSDEELEEVHKHQVDLFFNIESYLD